MIGGMSAVENDVIPYSLAIGNRAKVNGVNIIGLKRADYTKTQIREYSEAVEKIFTGETISKEISKLINNDNPLIKKLLIFLNKKSSRGLCKYEK